MTAGAKENKKLKAMDERRKESEEKASTPPVVAYSMRHPKGTNWQFITLTIQDGKVINEEVKQCDDKQHAIESFQIAFVNRFIDGQ